MKPTHIVVIKTQALEVVMETQLDEAAVAALEADGHQAYPLPIRDSAVKKALGNLHVVRQLLDRRKRGSQQS